MRQLDILEIAGQVGYCGHQRVFMGFATAGQLCRASYADVLDERTGRGYQRRMSREHSLEFKKYIQRPDATSIPLTFNLRSAAAPRWTLIEGGDTSLLRLDVTTGPVLTQVDGQHRLGFLQDSPIQFAFMTFIGLTESQEMQVFRTINGKAKGLSSSLLDFTAAKSLGNDLARADPCLFVALGLNSEPSSPWYERLDLGGERTVGTKRVASLRTMRQAVARMVKEGETAGQLSAESLLAYAISFWKAVAIALPQEWSEHRRHMLVKGIEVYALMSLAGRLIHEAEGRSITVDYFVAKLSDFVDQIDWTNHGPLEGYGGAKGADMAFKLILEIRREAYKRVSHHA